MNPELAVKSIHDLRVIAQSMGVDDIFEKDAKHLIQEIEVKTDSYKPPPPVQLPPRNPYDFRLLIDEPDPLADLDEVVELLEPLIALGLRVSFDEEHWFMSFGVKTDTGNLRTPLRDMLACAENLMR